MRVEYGWRLGSLQLDTMPNALHPSSSPRSSRHPLLMVEGHSLDNSVEDSILTEEENRRQYRFLIVLSRVDSGFLQNFFHSDPRRPHLPTKFYTTPSPPT
ncbi:hypothetical protein FRC03_005364 [Tulasnella sp. 419]|nr:hypothetical protein FRC03_005364 [Tulasnella sp. 419]